MEIKVNDFPYLFANLDKNRPIYCDTETSQLFYKIRLFQVFQEHWGSVLVFDSSSPDVLREAYETVKDCKTIWHNYCYDAACFMEDLGIKHNPFRSFEDTLLLSRLVLYKEIDSFTLDTCLVHAHGFDPYEKIGNKRELQLSFLSTKRRDMTTQPLEQKQVEYAAVDVFYLPKLYYKVKEARTHPLYLLDKEFIDKSLTWQQNGLPIIQSLIPKLQEKLVKENEEITKELGDVNVNSYVQVRKLLNVKSSTNVDLKNYALNGDNRASFILKKRSNLKKLNFLDRYNFERIYGFFSPTAISGRLRCRGGDKPGTDNLLQIPRDMKILIGYEENDPRVLISSDYSQLELRSITCLLGETFFYKAFIEGLDLHAYSAHRMFEISYEEALKDKQRRHAAKQCNFALLYACSPPTLKETFLKQGDMVISLEEAKRLKSFWLKAYPKVKEWQEELQNKFYYENPYHSTPGGRPYKGKIAPEMMGIQNQGLGAEVSKLALILFLRENPCVKVLNLVHDCIVLEASNMEEAKRIAPRLAFWMQISWYENIEKLKINDLPMPVEVGAGKDLLSADKNIIHSSCLTKEDYEKWKKGNAAENKNKIISHEEKKVKNMKEGIENNLNSGEEGASLKPFEEFQVSQLFPGKHLEIDADTILYIAAFENEDTCFEAAVDQVLQYIKHLKEITGCKSLNLHLTKGKCFRYALDENYKAKRRRVEAPAHLFKLKEYFAEKFNNVFLHEEWEADDAVVAAKLKNPEVVVCASDKDVLNGVTGKHFNFIKNEIVETSESYARFFPYYQSIVGDSGDNIKGVPGVGPKKVSEFIDAAWDEKALWAGVLKAFNHDEKAAILTMRLVRVDQVKDGKVELWNPPGSKNKFGLAHIAPLSVMNLANETSDIHMCLAHLVEKLGEEYSRVFKESKKYKILDNSYFELGESIRGERLIKAAKEVDADCIVLPDGSLEGLDQCISEGFEVMGVPTNLQQAKEMFKNEKIAKVGISSIHCAKVLDKKPFAPYNRPVFLSRLRKASPDLAWNKIHLLGASDCCALEWLTLKKLDFDLNQMSQDTSLCAASAFIDKECKHFLRFLFKGKPQGFCLEKTGEDLNSDVAKILKQNYETTLNFLSGI